MAAARTRPTTAKPRAPRPPTAAQLAARKQREYEREQARKFREFEAARKRANREYEATRKKRDREYAAAARQREREAAARRRASEREASEGGRREYARLAKERPYDKFKWNGKPYPVLGPSRTSFNIDSSNARSPKIAGRLPKLGETPAQERDRKARNDLRVRQIKGRMHDLEIDVTQAGWAVRAVQPGSKTYATRKAKYDRLRAQYRRLQDELQRALDTARTGQRGKRGAA